MSKCKHNWHLYNFTPAKLVEYYGVPVKQLVEARFDFVCSECGSTKHYPSIKHDSKDSRQIIKRIRSEE